MCIFAMLDYYDSGSAENLYASAVPSTGILAWLLLGRLGGQAGKAEQRRSTHRTATGTAGASLCSALTGLGEVVAKAGGRVAERRMLAQGSPSLASPTGITHTGSTTSSHNMVGCRYGFWRAAV